MVGCAGEAGGKADADGRGDAFFFVVSVGGFAGIDLEVADRGVHLGVGFAGGDESDEFHLAGWGVLDGETAIGVGDRVPGLEADLVALVVGPDVEFPVGEGFAAAGDSTFDASPWLEADGSVGGEVGAVDHGEAGGTGRNNFGGLVVRESDLAFAVGEGN